MENNCKNNQKHYKKRGFTLTEMVTVIIILGIFMTVAIPSYSLVIERFRAQEAVGILQAMYAAQQSYIVDHPTGCGTVVAPDLPVSSCYAVGNQLWQQGYIDYNSIVLDSTEWNSLQSRCGRNDGSPTHHCIHPLSYELTCNSVNVGYLASVKRVSSNPLFNYTLYALDNGRILCSTVTDGCDAGICRRLGFPSSI